jgi:hypothetical protein
MKGSDTTKIHEKLVSIFVGDVYRHLQIKSVNRVSWGWIHLAEIFHRPQMIVDFGVQLESFP